LTSVLDGSRLVLDLECETADQLGRNPLNRKQSDTLLSIFEDPVRANINWRDVEFMFKGLGAEITEGRGSRVRVALNGVKAVLHEPHPQKEIGKGMVRSLRGFLTEAGIEAQSRE
jgi:HicA toxin of bacterial toxin-antitoxin,